ncbi:3'-5' exonuclease (plasmid) [Thalassobaculum sp. OXR-137]|uniref:3'-5' exonuclease n=1 Tax=Thalassobaculum sp. OXR-137 TaxID=3100173 RepID=UPI002AC91ED8|nr:3'-5' exonuclease [Thalassobaculum sp. OXR-137]WPZ37266.1 3'-5' exonuclease [Thalassobaculum sp. OXR-137]
MINPADYKSLADALERSPDYRVLRRVVSHDQFAAPIGETKVGIILDTETTGLDPRTDQIIELAMLAFEYDERDQVCQVLERYQSFNDPGRPIPPEVTQLTGISDDMVAGHSIDLATVERLAETAVIVIAHNAAFDRRFAERLHPIFGKRGWGCSLSEVPWSDAGIRSAKLEYLGMCFGLFHDGHRAIADCEMLLEILAMPFPKTETPTLELLLEAARKPTFRIWALDSPFELKDLLKARGYRWNDGSDGNSKAWYRDVPGTDLEAERTYLRTEIYSGPFQPYVVRMTAMTRFSNRIGEIDHADAAAA